MVEIIFLNFEAYHAQRLLDMIFGFRSVRFYRDVGQKVKKGSKHLPTNEVKVEDIKATSDGGFIVKSKSKESITYAIDTRECTCTCLYGRSGRICKHIVGIYLYTNAKLAILPPRPTDKDVIKKYYTLATNKHNPPSDLFSNTGAALNVNQDQCAIIEQQGFDEAVIRSPQQHLDIINQQSIQGTGAATSQVHRQSEQSLPDDMHEGPENELENTRTFEEFFADDLAEIKSRYQSNCQSPQYTEALSRSFQNLKRNLKRKTSGAFIESSYADSKPAKSRKGNNGMNIHPNPASKARRRKELSRGNATVKKGRPKRKHNQSYNETLNQANAK